MSLGHEFMNVLNMIAVPGDVVEELKSAPRWRAPVMLSMMVALIVGWFMVPAMEQPFKTIYERSFGEAGAAKVLSSTMKFYFVGMAGLQALLIPLRWLAISTLLSLFARTFGRGVAVDFRRLFSAVAYAEIAFVGMSILTVLILYAKGIDTIEKPIDLVVFRGLDYFLHDQTPSDVVPGFLSSINIFSVWYVYLLSTGMRIMGDEPGRRALGISAAAWCAWAGLAALQPLVTEAFFRLASA